MVEFTINLSVNIIVSFPDCTLSWGGRWAGHKTILHTPLARASLSEPHTSVTALQDACVCMSVCMWPHIENLNWINGYDGTHTFQIYTHAKALQNSCLTQWTPHYWTPRQWIYWMRQRTPHRVTQHRWIYWVWETDWVWRDRRRVCEHKRRAAEQPTARQAWNDAEEQNTLSLVL